jgi:hypothetical protein
MRAVVVVLAEAINLRALVDRVSAALVALLAAVMAPMEPSTRAAVAVAALVVVQRHTPAAAADRVL